MRYLTMTLFAASLALVALTASRIVADEATQGAAPETEELESTLEARQPANMVNFNVELELPFASLADLGNRIVMARSDMDPVRLASAASELAVAEEVAGKTASVKSEELSDEAVEMAKWRLDIKELKAVALLTDSDLDEPIRMATEYAELAEEAEERGEQPRGIRRNLRVFNSNAIFPVRVFANGRLLGRVRPQRWGTFYVGDPWWATTRLFASDITGDTWREEVPGDHLGLRVGA